MDLEEGPPCEPFINEAHCSRTLHDYSINWQEVTRLKIDWSTRTNMPKEDFRATMPQSESELQALQLAISPTLDDFTYLTRREPRMPNPWLSYNDQMDDFQRQLTKMLAEKGYKEAIWLPRLNPWSGGIDSDEIQKVIRQRVPARDALGRLDAVLHNQMPTVQRNPVWTREYEIAKLAAEMQSKLELQPLVERYKGDQSVDNPQEARLNQLVANDGEAYRCWLCTVGLTYYENEFWGSERPQTWDFWCRYIAPSVFVLLGRQSKRKPMVTRKDCPAVEIVQRPVISLEEAARSRKAWIGSKEGRRVSFESIAYLHALKSANPVLADMEIDRMHYCINGPEAHQTKGAKPAVKGKRKRMPDSSTKPVKRVHFEDDMSSAKGAEFIKPALLIGT